MRKQSFFAVYEPSKDGGYGVYFPDLPGCISYGKTYEEAADMAGKALGLHLYGMEKAQEALPKPSLLNELEIDEETENGYIISPVTAYPDIVKNELDNRAVKTNITLPAWLKEAAEEQHINYSQLLQAALREYLRV